MDKFSLDGAAFMNIVTGSDIGQEFSTNYEPILESSDIKSCIFGINLGNKFEKVRLSNISTILFKANSGVIFILKIYREK